jgi:hypothetical protein
VPAARQQPQLAAFENLTGSARLLLVRYQATTRYRVWFDAKPTAARSLLSKIQSQLHKGLFCGMAIGSTSKVFAQLKTQAQSMMA